MYSNKLFVGTILLILSGCGSIQDDIYPSGSDQRPPVECGVAGPYVCQVAPDFTLSDSLENPVTLSSIVPVNTGVVLYFTMWCPTCDSHMMYMQDVVIPAFPNVAFFAVDYVSGSVSATRTAETSNGYAGSGFTVLADTAQSLLNEYNGTMATTVVIDKNGIVQMNETFKTNKLQSVLGGLP